MTIQQDKQRLADYLDKKGREEKLYQLIFGDTPIKESDCNNCPYFYDCDGDANNCKFA